MLAFIDWNPDVEIINIFGLSIRWYGLLFASAFFSGYKLTAKMFKHEQLPDLWLEKLFMYVMIATVAGARLGHCFFYDFAYFKDNILEIFLPVRFDPRVPFEFSFAFLKSIKFIGYQGLASHGAAIGIITALWIYSRKISKKSILWILDRVVLSIALAGFFIRMGNLMNSEIIGVETTMPWGFRFLGAGIQDPMTPRHPSQLYEALCYLLTFCVLMYGYWKTNVKEKQGVLFGIFLVMIFTARFFIEFIKENQESFEESMTLNMGQMLSIPFILIGIGVIVYRLRK